MSVDPPTSQPVLNPQQILELQKQASDVFVHNLVAEYIVRLVLATRTPAEFNMPDLTSVIQIGCSPRATLGLVAAARALALIHGRDYVLPTDVQAVAKDVMSHRLVLGFDAVADNIDPGPGGRADRRHGPAADPGVEPAASPSQPERTACPASGRRRSRTSAEAAWSSTRTAASRPRPALPPSRRRAARRVPAAGRRSGVPAAARGHR